MIITEKRRDKHIPYFDSVIGVFLHCGSTVLIINDLDAGKPCYTVIRICRKNGKLKVIGRELPLELARVVAKRDEKFDGMPIE